MQSTPRPARGTEAFDGPTYTAPHRLVKPRTRRGGSVRNGCGRGRGFTDLVAATALASSTAACGGRIEDSPAPPATTTRDSAANVPSATPACEAACTRIRTCTGFEDLDCATDCARRFTPRGAAAYASCIDALTCETIERGLFMDYGPLGECHQKARGAMRSP